MRQMAARRLAAFAISCCVLLGAAHAADPLPAKTRIVAAANAGAPNMLPFNIAAAEDLVVTLTDIKVPAALVSAGVVVTQGDVIAGSAKLAPPATTATFNIPAASGDYTLYVVGVPDSNFSVGTYTVCIARQADPSNCIPSASLAGNVTAQSTALDPTVSTLSTNLTVTTAGPYTFNFADLQFPVVLNTPPNLALFQGSTPVQLGIAAGSAINLNAGTYTLLAIAQADQSVKSGLYGITITGPGGTTPLLDQAIPVGLTSPAARFDNPADQTVTLKVSDYGFPGPLAGASALLTAGGTALGTASAAGGAASFAAPTGTLNLWTYGSPGATAGTYSADVAGAADLFTTAQGVAPTGSSYAYAFVTPVLTAGAYQATAADLQFPAQLSGLSFAVAQNGVIVLQSGTAGTVNFNATAGNAILLVGAQTPAGGGTSANGLFDVNVQTTGASAQLVYDRTQSVSSSSALFDSQTLTLGVNGTFDAHLTDLKFPDQFQDLALVVSRGSEVLGKIYGGGVFSFPATPGSYQLTFVATPSAQQQFGLYGVSIVSSPPAITLTSDVSTATTGTAINLSWSADNATSCTASGGSWTGTKATSSSTEAVVLTDTTTYTLTCTGGGGTASQSVTVTATPKPAPSGGGGGGGALGLGFLAFGSALLAARLAKYERKRSRTP